MVRALVYDLNAKKWGHIRNFFATSGHCYPEVVNIFVNVSVKTKIFSKLFWDVDLGPRYYRLLKKTIAKKFHATVLLRDCKIVDAYLVSGNMG